MRFQTDSRSSSLLTFNGSFDKGDIGPYGRTMELGNECEVMREDYYLSLGGVLRKSRGDEVAVHVIKRGDRIVQNQR